MELPMKRCPTCKGVGRITDRAAVAADLRVARRDIGVSLRTMAGNLGITPTYLSDLERGNRLISDRLIASYTELLAKPRKPGRKPKGKENGK